MAVPYLFMDMDGIMWKYQECGLSMNGLLVKGLVYIDNLVILASSEELQE